MAAAAYLALGYKCNHHCTCCPCDNDDSGAVDFEQLKASVNQLIVQSHIDTITLSGGEPTLYPAFLNLIQFLKEKNLRICVLTNADRFSDIDFAEAFIKAGDCHKLQIITTLHSSNPEMHEDVNGSKGSFERTLKGLHYLIDGGIHVIVKHCITGTNYQSLKDYVEYINLEFPINTGLQFSGIDYVGMTDDKDAVLFKHVKPHLEAALDMVEAYRIHGKKRFVCCINIPLCAVDPFYWSYFIGKTQARYDGYVSPGASEQSLIKEVPHDIGTFSERCKACNAVDFCCGTYRSAFEYFGDQLVTPF